MADAIPLNLDTDAPKKAKPKVNVAPKVDNNGVAVPDDYIVTVRENLGDPADFNRPSNVTEIERPMTVETIVDGKLVYTTATHKAIRTDY